MSDGPIVKYRLEDFVLKQSRRLGIDFAPTRAHDTDAGADLRCVRDVTIPARGSAVINTGVHVELPPNTKGEVKSKSGLYINHGILTTGLIDEGFSGSIRVRLTNTTGQPYQLKAGDKVTQLVVSPVFYPTFERSNVIQGGERGDAGFGSTGAR